MRTHLSFLLTLFFGVGVLCGSSGCGSPNADPPAGTTKAGSGSTPDETSSEDQIQQEAPPGQTEPDDQPTNEETPPTGANPENN